MKMNGIAAALAASVCIVALATPAQAQERAFNIPAGNLKSVLDSYGRQSGRPIIYKADDVRGIRSYGYRGTATPQVALDAILANTGFIARADNSGAVAIVRSEEMASSGSNNTSGEGEILVTGSRIRGAPTTSPMTTITREDAQRSGQTDLGQVIRDLPQNFSGGQNPTIAASGQGGSNNLTGSSALNLRGLGPDASLTLINGHRVAFDATSQGIDISAIPLAAIERVDVMADGASALHGSDAVAGVANVILRREVDGVFTSGRLGLATDGGAVTQQYSIVAGPSWRSGSLMGAADFQQATAIMARQRSYTTNLPADATLIPRQKQLSLVVSARQELSETINFEIDGHYMHRSTSRCMAFVASASCFGQGTVASSTVDNWSVTPSLRMELPSGWNVRLSGTYSESDTSITTRFIAGGVQTALALPNYVNDLKAIELGAEGLLIVLPGGEARLAVGGGYRSNTLDTDSRRFVGETEFPIDIFNETREVLFGYGELSLPLVSPANAIRLVDRLHLTGAVRYEDHRNIAGELTPKIGLLFSPIEGLEFKGSWGTSFKVPTLFQTGQETDAQLLNATVFNPSAPGGLPVLYLFGGSRELGPERATTWSVSAAISPPSIEDFKAEVSYFRVRYRDRVASPISPLFGAFQPIFSDFVMLSPSEQDVLSVIEGITGVFSNNTANPFNPAAVSAIVSNQLRNVALQSLDGVDVAVTYAFDLDADGRLTVKGSGSYLNSTRRVTESLPTIDQAGVIFTPPHWRGRLSGSWEREDISLSAILTHIGRTEDNRFSSVTKVDSFTTLDTVVTIRSSDSRGLLANIDWTVAVQNLFNDKPAFINTTDPAALRYDSINHSAYGRVVSITLSKAW